MSRSKMLDLIKGGDVRVNWKTADRPAMELKQGDMISVGGKVGEAGEHGIGGGLAGCRGA